MNKNVLQLLRARVRDVIPAVTELRRRIHAHPELALQETRTRAAVQQALRGTGLEVWEPLLGTDFIGELRGAGRGTICLRADMDALPLEEKTAVPYRSSIPGRMHACGHDGHTAVLVGACLVLDALREHLPVSVRFVFQPGEELVAAGATLVQRGACRGADAAFALHAEPGLPVGCLSAREGTMNAAADVFQVEFVGRGCHGAMPEKGLNPIPIAADAVARLYELHKSANGQDGSVVTVCAIRGGTNDNVIPDAATIQGTVRYLVKERGDELQASVQSAVTAAAEGTGAEVRISYDRAYGIPVSNSRRAVRLVRALATENLPAGSWRETPKPSMGAEDFAFYLQGREGAMILLGMGEVAPPLHSSAFDFNDDALPAGILLLSLIALHADNL
ncbi:MAG TPA: M20 family metallopeptidase [Phycisphaerae bacterium]|nr:M20 family metallopeptidase [Phycisphaerae bacterium]